MAAITLEQLKLSGEEEGALGKRFRLRTTMRDADEDDIVAVEEADCAERENPVRAWTSLLHSHVLQHDEHAEEARAATPSA